MFDRQVISEDDGQIVLFRPQRSDMIPSWVFPALREHTPWEQRNVVVWNREVQQPRLTCLYSKKPYTYSGMTLTPLPFTPLIEHFNTLVQTVSDCRFNSVLLNYYRNGKDSIGFHADDEPELGNSPVVASLSLGGERPFLLKHKQGAFPDLRIDLQHGDIVVMGEGVQQHWKHGINKSATLNEPRISLTFRKVVL